MADQQLTMLPWRFVDVGRLTSAVVAELAASYWHSTRFSNPVQFDHGAHWTRLQEIMYVDPATSQVIYEYHHTVDWGDLTVVAKHGNPSFDDLRLTPEGRLVLGPMAISTTGAIPDLQAVDLGMILKSLMGFELAVYQDWTRPAYDSTAISILFALISDQAGANARREIVATKYWAVFHMLSAMTLGKATDDQRQRVIAIIKRILK